MTVERLRKVCCGIMSSRNVKDINTHEVSLIWLPKHDLSMSAIDRQANMERRKSIRLISYINNYRH